MARHGVWQLNKLTMTYCEFSGSSRGARCAAVTHKALRLTYCPVLECANWLLGSCREFLQTMMPVFREQNPQLKIEERTRPGHHPWLKAEYSASLDKPTVAAKEGQSAATRVLPRQALLLATLQGILLTIKSLLPRWPRRKRQHALGGREEPVGRRDSAFCCVPAQRGWPQDV